MKYTIESATKRIKDNGGMVDGKKVWHSKPGLKILGAIDFLVNHHGFIFAK